MRLPRYEIQKSTGIKWLNKIPSHWELHQARRLFEQRRDAALPGDEQLSATQKYGVIPQRMFMEQESQKLVLALSGLDNFKRVKPDDFVISLRSFQGGIERTKYAGCVSPAYTVLRPKNGLVAGFWEYLLKSSSYIAALQTTTDGIREGKNIGYAQFGALSIPLPPSTEQTAIAAFLDRETVKIDALVAEQEKLIPLLDEKRQAIISHIVTKGLNSNAPTKNSGLAWLENVPAHWSVIRLKFIASVQTGIAKGKDTTGKKIVTVPYLRVANVQDGFLALEDVATIDIEVEQLDRYRLIPGDVLMNEGGDFDKLGRGAIWHGEITDCIHQNHVFAVRPHGVSAEWLNRITSSQYAQFYFMGRSKQSTNLASISATNIMELPVVLPPQSEQQVILEFIDSEIAKLDSLRDQAQRAISLLTERRSALIAAAVTGQIDVRSAVSQAAPQTPEPIAA